MTNYGIVKFQAVASRLSPPNSQQPQQLNAQRDTDGGVERLQAVLARRYAANNNPQAESHDNSGNLNIPEQQGYQPVDYHKMLADLKEAEDKHFGKSAVFAGASNLGGAIGGANANYQRWW